MTCTREHRTKYIWIGWPHFILLALLFIIRAQPNKQLVGRLVGIFFVRILLHEKRP